MQREDIIEAYLFLRKNDHSIPDEVLDFIKGASLAAFDSKKSNVVMEWIERSKRNPKKRGAYLVYKSGIEDISICNFGTSRGWENGRNLGVDNIYRVTHWMPLPEPPNE